MHETLNVVENEHRPAGLGQLRNRSFQIDAIDQPGERRVEIPCLLSQPAGFLNLLHLFVERRRVQVFLA